MPDDLGIRVSAELDEAKSQANINKQVNNIRTDPIKIPVEVDPKSIQDSVKKASRTKPIPIDAAFNINLKDTNAVRAEVQRLVAQMTGNKGNLVDFKIDTKGLDKAKKVLLTYKNEAQETVNTVLKLRKTSETLMPDGTKKANLGWVIDSSSYQKSYEQLEKAQTRLEKLAQRSEKFKAEISKNTKIKDQFDFSKLDTALNEGNVKAATSALGALTHQYDLFKVASKKDLV